MTDNGKARTTPCTPWLISDGISSQNVTKNKRLRSLAKRTPWIDRWEFEWVGLSLVDGARALPLATEKRRKRRRVDDTIITEQQLEATHSSSLQNAMHRVSLWKVRVDNRLPHAVESSYQLASCLWNDYNYDASSSRGAEELRLAYSCAVLRAINGLADAMQQQRSNAASVAVLCGELGIPSWLVDVRHEATHNQMPSLSVLRLSASTLLEYFHREFWLPEIQSMSSGDAALYTSTETSQSTVPTTANLVKHLDAYQRQQTKLLTRESSAEKNQSPKRALSNRSSPAPETKKSTPKVLSIALDYNNKNSNSSSDSEEDNDEEMYLDGLSATKSSFWSPPTTSLGTSANRFAALQDTSQGKKKKANKKRKVIARKQDDATKSNEPSAHHHAKQFVKTAMNHLELAQHTALLFLVWGGVGANQPTRQGALIPACPKQFPATGEGTKKIRQHYGILLTVLGKEWPGFLKSLMIHIVDHILLVERSSLATETDGSVTEPQVSQTVAEDTPETTTSTTSPERKLFFLDSWARFLVSREFVMKLHPDGKKTRSEKSNRSPAAPWSSLEKMWYPLNSLCDRLLSSPVSASNQTTGPKTTNGSKAIGSTSQRLAAYFVQILGRNRVAHFGVVDEDVVERKASDSRQETSAVDGENLNSLAHVEERAETTGKASLSLHQMEALLFSAEGEEKEESGSTQTPTSTGESAPGVPTVEINETSKQAEISSTGIAGANVDRKLPQAANGKRSAWVRCTVWEPCTIGALPGHPCSS